MRILYLDCFSGISGDMCLGALIDAGMDSRLLEEELHKLPLQNWDIKVSRESSRGITGTRVKITVQEEHQPHRCLSDIRRLITESSLPEKVQENSLLIFQRLAEAEGKVHGVPADHVHFHEVGAVDSILDIVGTAHALYNLNVDRMVCSPLPTGSGYITCRHGLLPVPAPATAELLKGVPLRDLDIEGELVTPTGAAIATTLSGAFGTRPEMTLDTVGYGLGSKDFGIPNFLRVFLGSSSAGESHFSDTILVMETNIDDMNPEFLGYVMERLLENGALDTFVSPAYMKKNRPGYLLTVLCRPDVRDTLMRLLFKETTTLGIRFREENRAVLKRSSEEIDTPYGLVRTKFALDNRGVRLKAAPEYEDCRRIAAAKGIAIRDVYNAALLAAERNKSPLE